MYRLTFLLCKQAIETKLKEISCTVTAPWLTSAFAGVHIFFLREVCICWSCFPVQYGTPFDLKERMGNKILRTQSSDDVEIGDIEEGSCGTSECYIRVWKAGGEHEHH
jgi:hypothetical protein